jgi:hypothetical protein
MADKLLGNTRPVIGTAEQRGAKYRLTADTIDNGGYNDPNRTEYALTGAGSAFTATLEGHYYGLGTLAPRVEPIMIAQVPYSGSQIESIVKYGTGSYNVDGTRIGPGRFPSNFAMVHHPDCVCVGTKESCGDEGGIETIPDWRCVDGCPVKSLETQNEGVGRYTYQADWSFEILEQIYGDNLHGVNYSPKVSTTEREAGMFGKLPCMLCGELNSEYHAVAGRQERCRRNYHPTLKPIKMMIWLAKMLSIPNAHEFKNRHLYIPFAGAGSEMIASLFADWDIVTGCELERGHVDIARLRLQYWQDAITAGYTVEGVLDSAYDQYRQQQTAGQLSLLE